jgi:hypothetical protein
VQAQNLVTNGGFETGDFTGWTQFGNTDFSGAICEVFSGGSPTEGFCQAFFGPVGSTGGIEQALDVGATGRPYTLDFDLYNSGGAPTSYGASFGGVDLDAFPIVDSGAFGYTHFHFTGDTNAAVETLAFEFQNDPSYFLLDNVSLSVPEPATLGLLGVGLVGMFFSRRRKAA